MSDIDTHYDEYHDEATGDAIPASAIVRAVQSSHSMQATSEVGRLLEIATTSGLDVEKLEKLVALYERQQDRQAKAVFDEALAAFQRDCPPVKQLSARDPKFKKVTLAGTVRPSTYADLNDIQNTIAPFLAKHGLSAKWGDTKVDGELVTLTCVVSHKSGHSEPTAATMPYTSNAGCSIQQKVYATVTYLRRLTLISATGIRCVDDDHDGNEPENVATLDEGQVATIEDFLSNFPQSARAAFLTMHRVDSLEKIPASKWDYIVTQMRQRMERFRTEGQ